MDQVKQPEHYTKHPSGIECIEVTKHMNFCRGNAVKYLWRAGDKDPSKEIEDLQKAMKYIEFEIERLSKSVTESVTYCIDDYLNGKEVRKRHEGSQTLKSILPDSGSIVDGILGRGL